jgi:hypothetical protein
VPLPGRLSLLAGLPTSRLLCYLSLTVANSHDVNKKCTVGVFMPLAWWRHGCMQLACCSLHRMLANCDVNILHSQGCFHHRHHDDESLSFPFKQAACTMTCARLRVAGP